MHTPMRNPAPPHGLLSSLIPCSADQEAYLLFIRVQHNHHAPIQHPDDVLAVALGVLAPQEGPYTHTNYQGAGAGGRHVLRARNMLQKLPLNFVRVLGRGLKARTPRPTREALTTELSLTGGFAISFS